MTAYVARRLAAIVVLAFGVSIVSFLIIHLIPGDPVMQMIGFSTSSTAEITNLRHQLGLDLPLPVQYVRWLGNVLRGNLGYSYTASTPVTTLIAENIPYTLALTGAAMAFSLVVGIPLGAIAALTRGTIVDMAVMVVALIALAMPAFWLGLLLIVLVSVHFHVLAAFGGTSWQGLILPGIALGAGTGGIIARFVRASIIEMAGQLYVTTARSKGLTPRQVFSRHILRNSLLPVLTLVGLQFGWMLSNAVIIETVFSRPGIGRLLVDSILGKDYLTVQGLVLLITLVYALINLAVDLLYPLIDPRIVYQ
jgi:ABC-type dipeptide/oligopeptide/nickel transport system permease component